MQNEKSGNYDFLNRFLLCCCRLLLCVVIINLGLLSLPGFFHVCLRVLGVEVCCAFYFLCVGGRSSQAIVEAALNAARSLVKDRLSGKSGGSDYSRQVLKSAQKKFSFSLFCVVLIFNLSDFRALVVAVVAVRKMWSS